MKTGSALQRHNSENREASPTKVKVTQANSTVTGSEVLYVEVLFTLLYKCEVTYNFHAADNAMKNSEALIKSYFHVLDNLL